MKIIYDEASGRIYNMILEDIEIYPKVMNVPDEGRIIERVTIGEDGKAEVVYRESTSEIASLKERLEQLEGRQTTTDLAVAEIAMQTLTERGV